MIMDLGNRQALTLDEEQSLEQKLSAAMTYTKHQHIGKAVATFHEFIQNLECIAVAKKESKEKAVISELAKTVHTLQELLAAGRTTTMMMMMMTEGKGTLSNHRGEANNRLFEENPS
jgi:hypothetical protein